MTGTPPRLRLSGRTTARATTAVPRFPHPASIETLLESCDALLDGVFPVAHRPDLALEFTDHLLLDAEDFGVKFSDLGMLGRVVDQQGRAVRIQIDQLLIQSGDQGLHIVGKDTRRS